MLIGEGVMATAGTVTGSRFSATTGKGDSNGEEMFMEDCLRFLLEDPEKLRKKLRRRFRFSVSVALGESLRPVRSRGGGGV